MATEDELLARIEELENQVKQLESQAHGHVIFDTTGPSAMVPDALKKTFAAAEDHVRDYFRQISGNTAQGTIEIAGERYLLLRASALSVNFLEYISQLYAERGSSESFNVGKNFLFDLAHIIGLSDAKSFHEKMKLDDPIARLSAGPVHFAYTGWALVEILPESNPTPDKDFFIKYRHPYSFEADSWIKSGKKPESTVCIMNAGYSSGWSEQSFGVSLTAVEIECRALGHENCTFLMSHPDRIEEHLEQHRRKEKISRSYSVPTFFERKKSEEELQKRERTLRTLINATTDMAYLADPSGILYAINQQAADHLKIKTEEAIGTNIFDDFDQSLVKARKKMVSMVLETRAPHQFEHRRENKIFIVSAYPILNKNQVELIAVFVRDITQQREYETRLHEATKEAQAANLAKSQFLANMSHEIRTPLNGVLGFLDLALMNCDKLFESTEDRSFLKTLEDHRENLKVAHISGNHLLNIINDILDLSKIESGRVDLEEIPYSAEQLLGEIEKEIFPLIKKKPITIETLFDPAVPGRVIGDPTKVKQIFLNLGSNAAKFTESGSITLGIEKVNAFMLRGYVKDTGIGIAADMHNSIFQKFIQADASTTRKYGGTGLGLALAKAYTELLGGSISVESNQQGGSFFSFTFNYLDTSKAGDRVSQGQPGQLSSSARLLVAEDHEPLQIWLQRVLSHYQVTSVTNGREALEYLAQNSFDLVLLDISMPEKSGIEVLNEARAAGYIEKTPVIAFTAHAMAEEKRAFLKQGFSDYITKPVQKEELLQKIEALLK